MREITVDKQFIIKIAISQIQLHIASQMSYLLRLTEVEIQVCFLMIHWRFLTKSSDGLVQNRITDII